ncbi:MAG: NUDIX domain-containing protein [Magnetococcales bacterium]|nr:NUDIX domain-containing protein [Magnetococcales bacterium]
MVIRPCGLWVEQGRLLTMRYQYSGQDRFNLPGGNREPGEASGVGLIREFQEEMGVAISLGDLLLTAETEAGGREVLHLVYLVEALHGIPRLNPQETKALALVWLDPEQLREAPLYPAIGPVLADWIINGRVEKTALGSVFQEWIA